MLTQSILGWSVWCGCVSDPEVIPEICPLKFSPAQAKILWECVSLPLIPVFRRSQDALFLTPLMEEREEGLFNPDKLNCVNAEQLQVIWLVFIICSILSLQTSWICFLLLEPQTHVGHNNVKIDLSVCEFKIFWLAVSS